MQSDSSSSESSVQMDILGELPVEVGEMILFLLNPDDLFCCYRVSKRWRNLVNSERLWSRVLTFSDYFPPASDFTECDSNGEEVCPTMRKYLADLVAVKSWGENKPRWTLEKERVQSWSGDPHTFVACFLLDHNHVWIPSLRRCGTGNIVELSFPIPMGDFYERSSLLGSEDGLFLAYTVSNLTYLYSRPSSAVEQFQLLDVIAFNVRRVKETFSQHPDGSATSKYVLCDKSEDEQCLISTWRNSGNGNLLEEFVVTHLVKRCLTKCEHFNRCTTGEDLVLCLHDVSRRILLLWNISSSRVEAFLGMEKTIEKVQTGWEGRGLCVSFSDSVVCYDCQGQILNTFVFPANYCPVDTLLIKSIPIVFVAVRIFSRIDLEVLALMEFRRGENSAKFGFEIILTSPLMTTKILGGPAYPVVVTITESRSLYLCIGLVSPRGVSTWDSSTFKYEGFNPLYLNSVQFVNGTSYILMHTSFHKHLLFKVLINNVKREVDTSMLHVVQLRNCREVPWYGVWADPTRLALQFGDRFLIKAYI